MRIERTGRFPPLTPRIQQFLRERLGGVVIDEFVKPTEKRADFLCLGDALIVELKTLEKDATERLDKVIEELRARPDWPIFFGPVSVEAYLNNIDDAEAVRRKLLGRVGRSIVRHLHKANTSWQAKQFASQATPRD